MNIEELNDQDLVQRARELAGMKKIKDKVDAEIRRRVECGDDLTAYGVNVGNPSERKKMKKAEDIVDMLLPAFVIEDLYDEPTVAKGRLTIS